MAATSPAQQSVNNEHPYPSGWNWGAAGLTWIWGIRFNAWLAFLTFVPALGGIWWIVLGMKGNEWAWNAHPWSSREEFEKAMAPWNMWGKILFIVSIALPIIFVIWAITLFSASSVQSVSS